MNRDGRFLTVAEAARCIQIAQDRLVVYAASLQMRSGGAQPPIFRMAPLWHVGAGRRSLFRKADVERFNEWLRAFTLGSIQTLEQTPTQQLRRSFKRPGVLAFFPRDLRPRLRRLVKGTR